MTTLPGEIPHLPFDTLGPIAEVAHPYLPAEYIALDALHGYYTRSSGGQADPRERGWMHLEQAVHTGDPSQFDQAETALTTATRTEDLANLPSAVNAHLALACIDAFRDRAMFGAVRPETADATYKKIVRLLGTMPAGGYSAEVAMIALGARMARERPEDFIYPSTPREGENALHNKDQQTYNHDGYTLNPYKTPIESKLHIRVHTPMSDYDDRTFRSFFLSLFSLTPDGPQIAKLMNDGEHATAARWLLDRVKMRMTEELNGTDNSGYFRAVQDYLRTNLREHRRINPMALEFDIPPAPPSATPQPSVAEQAPQSVSEVMEILNTALQSLSEEDIHWAIERLASAQEQLLAGGQGSDRLNEIAMALQEMPSERLQIALAALAIAREKLTAYLEGFSGA
ncbi:MAG TPA: hypothetical protein VLH86_03490 [Patescibacteria group bacterium]|nr:hypothetical protein [Patescibacteria group bacterium]